MKKIIKFVVSCIVLFILLIIGINFYVIFSTSSLIYEKDFVKEVDAIVVLGTSIVDGKPGKMLQDRLDVAALLYEYGVSDKLLLTGDNASEFYEEVTVMKEYLITAGVSEDSIILDETGYSTYASMYNINESDEIKSMVIVTQTFHLYRALNLGKAFDLEVYGYSADNGEYEDEVTRTFREFAARNKDFIVGLFKPEPDDVEEVTNAILN